MGGKVLSLGELCELVGGTLCGDPLTPISAVAPIDAAGPGAITFLANPKYLAKLSGCRASAVILTPGVETQMVNRIETRNPYLAFAKILKALRVPEPEPRGVMAGAFVDETADIGVDVSIHPGCVVGANVEIGDGAVLYPNVVLYEGVRVGKDAVLHAGAVVRERCILGDRVILQPGALIGADGFGYAPDAEGYFKIPQVGIVVLEDDVEIGASSCIDRATMGETRIQRGTKIDNLVQVGHNVRIGEHCILVSQSGIAGSTSIGQRCTFGGQSAASGHLKIGDSVTVGGRGGVTKNLESNQVVSGLPVMPHKEWLRATTSFAKLPELRTEIKEMKKNLARLEAMLLERDGDGSQ